MKKNHKHTVSRCVVRLHKLAEQRIKCGEIVALQLRVGAPAKDSDELAQRSRLRPSFTEQFTSRRRDEVPLN